MIVVKPVVDKKSKHDFLQAAHVVHAGDPHWVAPLFLERDEHLDPRKNPYFEHAEVQLQHYVCALRESLGLRSRDV